MTRATEINDNKEFISISDATFFLKFDSRDNSKEGKWISRIALWKSSSTILRQNKIIWNHSIEKIYNNKFLIKIIGLNSLIIYSEKALNSIIIKSFQFFTNFFGIKTTNGNFWSSSVFLRRASSFKYSVSFVINKESVVLTNTSGFNNLKKNWMITNNEFCNCRDHSSGKLTHILKLYKYFMNNG